MNILIKVLISVGLVFPHFGFSVSKLDNALLIASFYGDKAKVKDLIDAGANVNAQTLKTHDTAIIFAASKGHEEIVKLLIDAGANPKISNYKAFRVSLKNNHLNILQMLYEESEGYTPGSSFKPDVELRGQETLFFYVCQCIEKDLFFDDDRGSVIVTAPSINDAKNRALSKCLYGERKFEDDMQVRYCFRA